MTTQPAPAADNPILPDLLPPEDAAYLDRLRHALRCGVPGCLCANPGRFHCPCHDNPEVPTLSVTWNPDRSFSFECHRCSWPRILDALAKRGLMPRSRLYTSTGAVEAGLDPFAFFIQQPTDWLWPNRIPLGKLTLIAGYPSSGKTAIALDIAARVSRGAPAARPAGRSLAVCARRPRPPQQQPEGRRPSLAPPFRRGPRLRLPRRPPHPSPPPSDYYPDEPPG